MVKYDFIYTIFTLAAVDVVCASTMKSKAEKGVYLSAKGGVSFGEEFNSLKVDGNTALAIIRGGTLDASNSDENGLLVRDDGSAYVCKVDLIKGGPCKDYTPFCETGDGLSGVLLSDLQATMYNPRIYVVNARIEGGNADVAANGAYGGAGIAIYRGQAEIVSKKSSIVGGLYPDGTSRWVAIVNFDNLDVYEGHIGDAMTEESMNNYGSANIYGGKWMGGWFVGGTTNVYGKHLELDADNKLTGTLCDGNEIDVQIVGLGGTLSDLLYLFQEQDSCSHYEDYVTNTLPYPECE